MPLVTSYPSADTFYPQKLRACRPNVHTPDIQYNSQYLKSGLIRQLERGRGRLIPIEPWGPPAALYNSRRLPADSFSISWTVMSTVPPPQSTTIYRVPANNHIKSWLKSLVWAQHFRVTQTFKLSTGLKQNLQPNFAFWCGCMVIHPLAVTQQLSLPPTWLDPFHGGIAVPSVTRCRCRRGHRCAGGARQYR